MIVGIVLAAGEARRLGRPKQLEPWAQATLLEHVIGAVASWPVDDVWVVLGAESETILRTVDFGDAGIVENPEWEEGIASSLRVGLDAVGRLSKADAALVALGDQPDIEPGVPEALIESHRQSRSLAVVPKYRYVWGNPVLIDRRLWPRVMSLEGDHGARQLLQSHPEWVDEVWFPHLPPRDVNTEDDVAALRPRGTP